MHPHQAWLDMREKKAVKNVNSFTNPFKFFLFSRQKTMKFNHTKGMHKYLSKSYLLPLNTRKIIGVICIQILKKYNAHLISSLE